MTAFPFQKQAYIRNNIYTFLFEFKNYMNSYEVPGITRGVIITFNFRNASVKEKYSSVCSHFIDAKTDSKDVRGLAMITWLLRARKES